MGFLLIRTFLCRPGAGGGAAASHLDGGGHWHVELRQRSPEVRELGVVSGRQSAVCAACLRQVVVRYRAGAGCVRILETGGRSEGLGLGGVPGVGQGL